MLQRTLEGCVSDDSVEVMTDLSTILSKIPLDELFSVCDKWKCRLGKRIDKGGEHLETD
jgi:hypothetical protein